MDNNQQISNSRADSSPNVGNETSPSQASGPRVTDLNLSEPKTMTGAGIQSPFGGADVSMTTAQPYGGPIVTTEQGKVTNQTGPNA